MTNFKEKVKLFNSFFLKQCSLIFNNNLLLFGAIYLTEKRLATVILSAEDIIKNFRSLISNKVNRHDSKNILMLKLCDDSISARLEINEF